MGTARLKDRNLRNNRLEPRFPGAGAMHLLHLPIIMLLLSGTAYGREWVEQAEPQQVPLLLAVGLLDLEPNNVDAGEVRAISDRLRYYLGNYEIFAVIERARMEDILKEVGFQLTGACITEECIVQVGKILGAQKMVAGSVSRVGGLYTIQIRLIDIQSSRIEHQAIADVRGIEEVLQIGCRDVAEELATRVMGRAVASPARPERVRPAEGNTGFWFRGSVGPGATVFSSDAMDISGISSLVSLAFGRFLRDGLVVYGDIIGCVISGPTVKTSQHTVVMDSDFSTTLSGWGVGMGYYPARGGLYMGATVAVMTMSVEQKTAGAEASTDPGIGLSLILGRDFTLSSKWTLGAAGHVVTGSMKDKGGSPTWSARALGVSLSFSYSRWGW